MKKNIDLNNTRDWVTALLIMGAAIAIGLGTGNLIIGLAIGAGLLVFVFALPIDR
jgi:hypothetical protein